MTSKLNNRMGKTSSIWNSIDNLGTINTFAQWALAVLILLSFVFTAVALVAAFRKEALQRVQDLGKEKEVADTRKLAADANERAATLEQGAARDRTAAEELRNQNLRLEADVLKLRSKLAWRELNPRQLERITLGLKRFRGQKFEIITFPDDLEAVNFSNEIASALIAAGWAMVPTTSFLGFLVETGVMVLANQFESEPAQAFVSLIEKEGVKDVTIRPNGQLTIQIRIGKKPPSRD